MADHINQNIITQVLLGGTTYDIHDKAAIHDIEDLGLGGNPLVFKGIVATRAALDDVASPVTGWVYLVTADQSEWVYVEDEWELMDSAMVGEHTHAVVVPTKENIVDASKVVSAGEVVAGSDVVFTAGSHAEDSFVQGEDTFVTNVPTTIDTTKFSGGSFTQGTDSFSAGSTTFEQGTDILTPGNVTINYTKQELDFDAATFEQGTDSFTANTPTVIDTTKFNAGSASISGGSASLKDSADPSWGASVDANGVLSFSWDAGSHGSVDYTAPELAYTAPSLGAGFYTAGSAASFQQGTDSFNAGSCTISDGGATANYTAPTFTQGKDTFGYTAPTFTQGIDSFTAAKLNTGFYTVGKAATFEQGTDTFTQGTYVAPTLTGGKATVVALPTFSTVSNLWSGNGSVTVTSGDPEAAE